MNLNHLRHENLRNNIGNFCAASAGLAIHGTNTENVLTANAVSVSINGVLRVHAADAEIDLSAEFRLVKTSAPEAVEVWALAAAAAGYATLADGYANRYLIVVDASGGYGIIEGVAVAGTTLPDYPDTPPDSWCPIGCINIVNASGSGFDLGTTALSAVTDTYENLSHVPSSS